MTETDYYSLDIRKKYFFFTYYGDVYYGIMVQNHTSGYYYIIPSDNIEKYNNSNNETRNSYKKIGWEIKDLRIITKYKEQIDYNQSNITSIPFTTQCKRLFVFGAGASAYCSLKKTKKNDFVRSGLPMGNEIFSKDFCITSYYEGLQSVLPIYEAKGMDVESFLQLYYDKIRDKCDVISLRNLINIQICVQETIRRINNDIQSSIERYNAYSMFVSYLRYLLQNEQNQRISIVSFNYDTLLEKCIKDDFLIDYNNIENYVSPKFQIQLYKPHGSINWGWVAKNLPSHIQSQDDFIQYLYDELFDLDTLYFEILGDTKQNIKNRSWGIECEKHKIGRYTINMDTISVIKPHEIYYPSILPPYKDKDDFIMPYSQQYAMKEVVKSVEELYLIGWKGSENLFLKYLKQNKNIKKLIIVDPKAELVLKNIEGVNFGEKKMYKSFSDFVIEKIREVF